MPKRNKTIKQNEKGKEEVAKTTKQSRTKTGKIRKITRRKAKNTLMPVFLFKGEYYLSCYDIRNFLSDKQQFVNYDLKYEFRKKCQAFDRKMKKDRLVLEQKIIVPMIDAEDKIHINPNKKTVFVKMNHVEDVKGFFSYLRTALEMPIDKQRVIDMDKKKSQAVVELDMNEFQVDGEIFKESLFPFEN
eukprot:TRINITY_DN2918_c1_g1_i2.p1 TRINITY_DN2918_c1_g1~~TRINITY_DN2918_c1_g1_i2.p1  ORF type:complete len:188 (-),score=48.90 TRINITY_DN2918_c1_g1_i2:114-677(-)